MSLAQQKFLLYATILVAGVLAPFVFPNFTFQITVLWVMILFALTWDILGGQMGYNSLGNIFFFGVGMYACALVQIGLYTDVATYTSATGSGKIDITAEQYFIGLGLGMVAAAIVSVVFAVIFGWVVFGLRGPYFAIGTLGFTLAAGELVGGLFYGNYPGGSGLTSGAVFGRAAGTSAGRLATGVGA